MEQSTPPGGYGLTVERALSAACESVKIQGFASPRIRG